MTMFKRGCVILMLIWSSACGGENTTATSPSTSALSSASSTTPGGPALTTLHARIARGIHVDDGAIITFHIQDDRGAPIAGALLQATSTDVGPWQGLTDGAGNFIASLFAGHYNLTVSAAGFDTRTLPANLALTGTVTIGLARGNGDPIPPPSDPIPAISPNGQGDGWDLRRSTAEHHADAQRGRIGDHDYRWQRKLPVWQPGGWQLHRVSFTHRLHSEHAEHRPRARQYGLEPRVATGHIRAAGPQCDVCRSELGHSPEGRYMRGDGRPAGQMYFRCFRFHPRVVANELSVLDH